MRKLLFALISLFVLGLSSCNEITEINANFGSRTYVSDYSALLDAINDLKSTLNSRFTALDSLLQTGLANIQGSIDENTRQITITNQNMQDGLSEINTSIVNGFTATTDLINATGSTVIAAVNSEGQLLRLKMDSVGTFLSTQLIENNESLLSAIKENNDSLNANLLLINAGMQAGFVDQSQALADIKTAVDENTSKNNENMLALLAALAEISKKDSAIQVALADVKKLVQTSLLEDGINIDKDSILCVKPDVWTEISGMATSSKTDYYKALMDLLHTTKTNVTISGECPSDSTGTNTMNWAFNVSNISLATADPSLCDLGTFTLNGNTCQKIISAPASCTVSLNAKNAYYSNYYYCVRGIDARGQYQFYGEKTGTKSEIGEGTVTPSSVAKSTIINFDVKFYYNNSFRENVPVVVFTCYVGNTTTAYPSLRWNP